MRVGAVLICVCAERGLEDGVVILIATWHREGPAMTQQLNMNHGHPDGDLLTSILAYEWFLENKKHYANSNWNREWSACSRAGLMHHVHCDLSDSHNLIVLMWGSARSRDRCGRLRSLTLRIIFSLLV